MLNNLNFKEKIPKNVFYVCESLINKGFEAYLVGGCVRDLIISREPTDFDITTNATPEQIISVFGEGETVYENAFGTVGVKIRKDKTKKQEDLETSLGVSHEKPEFLHELLSEEKLKTEEVIEVTTFRKEGEYKDFRRPSKVEWGKNIEEDLSRRDFKLNAIAYDVSKDCLIDPFKGQDDIKNKTISCVGEAEERFGEDALRMLRAIRFSGQLDFIISYETLTAISKLSNNLEKISKERVRDEFVKILMTKDPMMSLVFAQKVGVLKYISHEIEKGVGVDQNQAHSFDVYEHNLRTLKHAADKDWPLHVRLAALFHDISKPETRRWSKEKNDWTFYGHDVVGGRVSREILTRLKFDKETIETVSLMVRWHMFFSDTEQITLSAVRRLVANVGKDRVWDLMDLRACDRIGTGRPKEDPYRLRMYKSMVAQALTDPVSLKQMKIDGQRIMSVTQETPGPKIGMILNALFAEVLENPEKNTVEYLEERALHMKDLSSGELKVLAEKGKDVMQEENDKKLQEIKKEFHVK